MLKKNKKNASLMMMKTKKVNEKKNDMKMTKSHYII